jgi:formylglycine-generating enzyme required for sulfatase activity
MKRALLMFALADCASPPAATPTMTATAPATATATTTSTSTSTASSTAIEPPTASAAPPPACNADEAFVPATDATGFLMQKGEKGEHRVVLTKPFCIDVLEVTVRQYKACVDDLACKPLLGGDPFATYPRSPDLPATMVSWNDAHAYCAWSKKRLPTEAEWEWAAGGPSMTKYPWGDTPEPSCETVDFTKYGAPKGMPGGDVGCGGGGPSVGGTHAKGDKVWGETHVHDLAGNVYEWVEDTFAKIDTAPATDPLVAGDTIVRVIRGGAWNRSWSAMSVVHRAAAVQTYKVPGIGARCVRTP